MVSMKNHLLEIMSLQITSSGKTNFKGWALFCILKVSSSECAVSNFLSLSHSRTSRTEQGQTPGALQLHKQGWIAGQMAQSMNNGNSIGCDGSTPRCWEKIQALVPPAYFLLFCLCIVSWRK